MINLRKKIGDALPERIRAWAGGVLQVARDKGGEVPCPSWRAYYNLQFPKPDESDAPQDGADVDIEDGAGADGDSNDGTVSSQPNADEIDRLCHKIATLQDELSRTKQVAREALSRADDMERERDEARAELVRLRGDQRSRSYLGEPRHAGSASGGGGGRAP